MHVEAVILVVNWKSEWFKLPINKFCPGKRIYCMHKPTTNAQMKKKTPKIEENGQFGRLWDETLEHGTHTKSHVMVVLFSHDMCCSSWRRVNYASLFLTWFVHVCFTVTTLLLVQICSCLNQNYYRNDIINVGVENHTKLSTKAHEIKTRKQLNGWTSQ